MKTKTKTTTYELRYQGAPYGQNESGELVSRHKTLEAAEAALRRLVKLSPCKHYGNTRVIEVK